MAIFKKYFSKKKPPKEKKESESVKDDLKKEKEILEDFLSKIQTSGAQIESSFETQPKTIPLTQISLSEYSEISGSEEIVARVDSLRQIVTGIKKNENATIKTKQLSVFKNLKVNYVSALNEAQLTAIVETEKPVLVIAGAGCGKTRVIVYRVAYLIEKGIDPKSILLLTFTRKAANEMLTRVEELLHNKSVTKVAGGTFHSFASNVLRKYANMLNLPSNFSIIDTSDSEDIIDLIRTELKFNQKSKKFPKKSRIQDIISYSRNKVTTIRAIVEKNYTGLKEFIPDLELIYEGYTRYKKASKLLDFDDLMDVLLDRLKTNKRFREKLQSEYNYIMVDEFQDTNIIQNDIVKILAESHRRVMVVGDDSQSIYAFRGANYENILRFPQAYPDCTVIRIEQNYRSTPNILEFTNIIVQNAKVGFKKELFSKLKTKNYPVIKQAFDQEEEAVFIVDRIFELNEIGVPLNEIAVLNRADWHNRYIQTELNKRDIPYIVVGGFKFNERTHVKDIIAYLRLTYNPSDAVAWHRILKYIGGIGRITAMSLVNEIQKSDSVLNFEVYRQKRFYEDLLELGRMLSKASQPEYNITQKIEIIKDYYSPLLQTREADYFERMQDIEVLIDLSRRYSNIDRFLSDFALDPPSKRVADQSTPLLDENEESGKITLSTVHSAKGLEWHTVFIPHALEGLFPSNRATNMEEMEEERRLFYVACSRAKEELYICFPRQMFSFDAFFHLPSRFLVEIDKEKYVFEGC